MQSTGSRTGSSPCDLSWQLAVLSLDIYCTMPHHPPILQTSLRCLANVDSRDHLAFAMMWIIRTAIALAFNAAAGQTLPAVYFVLSNPDIRS
ncbi:hypothetical protein E2C01_046206 [Portunus trituberculatus]|uniref:Uncharacterized protein n=1 Tax=Portunus trituberculatus TaxID=210409 RepID=A0A5B7FXU5_PORTR|nr:hypothetical protein [Portunus trituberculatus]